MKLEPLNSAAGVLFEDEFRPSDGTTRLASRFSCHRETSQTDKGIRAEVLVVGGGVSGAPIAQAVTSLGKHVTVIDSREIAAGSTMAGTAILSYEPDIHLADLIHKVGEVSAVRVYRAGIEAINSLRETINAPDDSCYFRRRKSLYLASNERQAKIVRRECNTRQKYHFEVELLTAGTSEIVFLRSSMRNSHSYRGGTESTKTYSRTYARCSKKGLKFYSHYDFAHFRFKGADTGESRMTWRPRASSLLTRPNSNGRFIADWELDLAC
jgi:hypothetical protein